MARVLVVGEQFTGVNLSVKGFDAFETNFSTEEGQTLVNALELGNHNVEWMRSSQVPSEFPEDLGSLKAYDVLILSDIGTNSFLFHPEMLAESIPHPNRLVLIKDYVHAGGGLCMIGGWMSFSGIDGKARYHHTPVEEILPVTCFPYDDRMEKPEGIVPHVMKPDHPILKGITENWPFFLGYNQTKPKAEAEVLVQVGADPLLCVGIYGKGHSAAFTSDCAPHWGPRGFLEWDGYSILWNNLVAWLGNTV